MRIPNPRLLRLGGITLGAITEGGDSELMVSSVMQPIVELSSPIDKCFGTAASVPLLVDDSFVKSHQIVVVGAGAGSNPLIMSFTKGLWTFDLAFTCQFSGTINQAQTSSLSLIDPDGASSAIFQCASYPSSNSFQQGRYQFAFQRDNFQFRLIATGTIAGDSLTVGASVNARRLM